MPVAFGPFFVLSFRSMPACDCPELFEGPHCEFVVSGHIFPTNDVRPPNVIPPNSSSSEDSGYFSKGGRAMINTLVLLVLIVFIAFLLRQTLRIIRRSRQNDQVVLNLQSFREENQGAVSANGSMLFPSMNNSTQNSSRRTYTMNELMHDVEIT